MVSLLVSPRGSYFTVTAPGRNHPLTSEGMPMSGEAAVSQGPPSCLASPGKASVQPAASPELKSLQFPSRSEGHMEAPWKLLLGFFLQRFHPGVQESPSLSASLPLP